MSQRKTHISLTAQPKQTASISAVEIIMLAVLLAVVFGINFGRQLSGDIWWHLKAGEWMLENRAFPFADPFSYTASHSWILQEWGFQVIAWVISGISLELLVWICFAAFLGALLVTYGTARSRGGFAAAFVVTLLAAGVCADMVDARPHVFGLLAFAALVRWIDRSARSDEGLPVLLPILFLVWANFHSSFTGGLVLLGVMCAASFYAAFRSDEAGRWGRPLRDLPSPSAARSRLWSIQTACTSMSFRSGPSATAE